MPLPAVIIRPVQSGFCWHDWLFLKRYCYFRMWFQGGNGGRRKSGAMLLFVVKHQGG